MPIRMTTRQPPKDEQSSITKLANDKDLKNDNNISWKIHRIFLQLTLKEVDTTNKMSSMNIMSSKTKSFYTKKYSHASEVEKFLHRKAFSPASSNKELQQYLIMSTLIFKNLNNMLTLNKILNLISKLNKVTLDLLN